ncbi:MAG TPA: hemin uptake protein HemP [Trinickia sp.]
MNEPTRQPTLTLRTLSSTATRARTSSKDSPTAALVTPRVAKRREPAEADGLTERTLSSDHLLQGQSHVFIAHNGERYQLRATRLGKLILTK